MWNKNRLEKGGDLGVMGNAAGADGLLRCVGYKEPGAVMFEASEDGSGKYEFGGGPALYVCRCSVLFSKPGEPVLVESCV